MTDDYPTPDEKKEKSDRFRRILSQPEEGGLPPFEEFDLPEPADGETLIFDIEEPDPRRVMGTDTMPLEEAPPSQPAPIEDVQAAQEESDTQPMRVRRPPAPAAQGSASGYRPTASGNTPPPPPALDANGMPLPRRVDEIDVDATRVSVVAYTRAAQPAPTRQAPPASSTPAPPPERVPGAYLPTSARAPLPLPAGGQGSQPPGSKAAAASQDAFDWRRAIGCGLRLAISGLFVLVVMAVCSGTFLIYQYYSIARDLPNVAELRQKASTFETTRILDRNGDLLYEILDPSAGRRTYVALDKISPYLVAATIATEDKEYYSHPGLRRLRHRPRLHPELHQRRDGLGGFHHYTATGAQPALHARGAGKAHLRPQDPRGGAGGGDHAHLLQG